TSERSAECHDPTLGSESIEDLALAPLQWTIARPVPRRVRELPRFGSSPRPGDGLLSLREPRRSDPRHQRLRPGWSSPLPRDRWPAPRPPARPRRATSWPETALCEAAGGGGRRWRSAADPLDRWPDRPPRA